MTRWNVAKLDELLGAFEPQELDGTRRRRRDRVLAAATELFTQHGYRRVSVGEIARRAQVAKGTVYLYYPTKAALLVHAIVAEKRRYLLRTRPLLESDLDPRERLRAWIRLTFELAQEMPLVAKLLQGDREVLLVLDELDAGLRESLHTTRETFFGDLIRAAAAPLELSPEEVRDRGRLLATLLYSAGTSFFDERARNGLSLDRFAEVLADTIVDGIAAPSAASTSDERRRETA